LGKIITAILRPCSSAPKSPTPPNSPNESPCKEKQIVEVTPCVDITNQSGGPPLARNGG